MDIKKLYKRAYDFERKVQQLEECNDSLSSNDWDTLEIKLADKYPPNKITENK